ncbi:condensation domain-containing protein [Chloroflexota bacterium]
MPIKSELRESETHWQEVLKKECKIPFEFNSRPAIRFILVQSPSESDLIILCHHIICDGMSLAYLARDIMLYLGDPACEVEVLPPPVPMDLNNIPGGVGLNGLAKMFIKRVNRKWDTHRIHFDMEDYQTICEAYWEKFNHGMITLELSDSETSLLVDNCRREKVTVNSALTAAFIGALYIILSDEFHDTRVTIAGNVRDRLPVSAGEAMGFFAGGVPLKYKYDIDSSFWDNARRFHKKAVPSFTDKNLLKELIPWLYLDASILEAFNFKKIGAIVSARYPRYQKLFGFSRREDVVSALLKRSNLDTFDKTVMGTAVTNLTRLDFPKTYGALELERLIMYPGGAFPLVNVNLVVGAVTCSGKLSLILEYAEEKIGPEAMNRIKEKALDFLLLS